MKLVSFTNSNGATRLGINVDRQLYDLKTNAQALGLDLPDNMDCFLKAGHETMTAAHKLESELKTGKGKVESGDITLLAPVPNPPSCRDAYAFRQHVATARRNRGVDMIPEFDQFPIFYFTNHNSIFGEGDIPVEKDHLEKLDFELEGAIVIGKGGKNISAKEADQHIAGYTIMNDLSARVLQMEEMKLSLGPAKGKDFGTVIGPWLVTVDELEQYKIETDYGNKYDLQMAAHHNGKKISDGNLKEMNWTFAEIIERASYGVELYPGDVIGSGTVGTGCYLELNGTWALEAKERGETHTPIWLQDGDTIDLEITGLGKLSNRIVAAKTGYSILDKKKIAEPA
ncbi:MAG: fumarylacetoacetate hydrolase family protein [bacterium]|nr:fumarylacetoacetate hydrolase family protein [bacterium]